MIEEVLQEYPRKLSLKSGLACLLRPLEDTDEKAFHEFFQAIPEREKLFIKHRVSDPKVIRNWCKKIDLGRILPLLAIKDKKIIGDCSLHQSLGGWKRHIGRISVLIHPQFRGRGLARAMVQDLMEIARGIGLEKMEAEFLGDQEAAMKMFGLMGFRQIVRVPDYVKDMQAVTHDYVLMGVDLKTDEEYASAG
ncbi:MAG: GNAT family N-acetyltransferase [Verrucomicrobia bacterium]|nr:GNAT family N-acetyltransferase [Verrucomicrobiota bacterium]